MEVDRKLPFWKKWKISIFGLEQYELLGVQTIGRTIAYVAITMLIFAFLVTASLTYLFHKNEQNVAQYIQNNIQTLEFNDNVLKIEGKDKLVGEPIIIEDEKNFNGKIIIDTNDLTQEKIEEYEKEIQSYYNGVFISKNEIKLNVSGKLVYGTIPFSEITEPSHIVHLEKQDIVKFLSGYTLDIIFFISVFIVLFINYFALLLLDAVLYSLIAYIIAKISRLSIKYLVAYNLAVYSLTLPVLLELIYSIVNILTGFNIEYFSVMYSAITMIYIITSILIIRSNLIKRQMELAKIIEEQNKIQSELARKELERQEKEEKERVRKKDEQERKKQKKEKNKENTPKEKEGPEPQANIKETD